jgi:hypothetical protein
MVIDIGTQIVVVLVFGIMALLTRRNYPEIAKCFGRATLILVVLFGVIDVINAIGLIKF